MINSLRKILFFIFKKIIPPYWIEQAINKEKIELSKKSCLIGEMTSVLSSANILNFQNNPNKIIIGNYSMICGKLQINEYGGKIQIGNYTYIGENTNVWSGDSVTIGNNVQVSHGVNIIDNNTHSLDAKERHQEYKEIITRGSIQNRGNIKSAPIIIEDDVWISFNASILKGVTIGKGAIIAANSVVTKNVEPYTMVAGNPAIFIKNNII
jgi:acetyltransferase-like isoleucine patch superfamily enzyme